MSAPIKHTCPDIDATIRELKSVVKTLEKGLKEIDKEDYTDIEYHLKSSISDIEDAQSIMESLRHSNGELRDWGESLEKQVSELEEQLESLQIINP